MDGVFEKGNDQPIDIAFQEKDVQSTENVNSVGDEFFVRLSDENVEYSDVPNENSDNDEEENDNLEFDANSSTNGVKMMIAMMMIFRVEVGKRMIQK
nr:hypothetical protein Itr_chr06CG16830 [Ipomoea trifida]